MSEWTASEPGPQCYCGWPTFVAITDGSPQLICFGHTPEEGASFPLPKARPDHWPNLNNDEMKVLVQEGMKEQELSPGDDIDGPQMADFPTG